MDKIRIGIVILNYNDYVSTMQLLKALSTYKSVDHILVVDNCSTNESASVLQPKEDDSWELICLQDNKGYASGNNIGIRHLINNYGVNIIGVANPDVYFSESFIAAIKADFQKHSEYAVITGIQTGINGEIHKHAFWKEMTIGRLILSNFRVANKIYERYENIVEHMLSENDNIFSVDTVEGCLFFIRAKDFIGINGFDEETFLYMEEDILTKRLKKRGRKIGVDPQISFIHAHSTSVNKAISYFNKMKISYCSKKIFLDKYLLPNKYIKILFSFSILLSWLEQIFVLYPCFRVRTIIKRGK